MIRRGRAGVFLSRVFLRLPGGGVDDDSAAPGVDNFFCSPAASDLAQARRAGDLRSHLPCLRAASGSGQGLPSRTVSCRPVPGAEDSSSPSLHL